MDPSSIVILHFILIADLQYRVHGQVFSVAVSNRFRLSVILDEKLTLSFRHCRCYR